MTKPSQEAREADFRIALWNALRAEQVGDDACYRIINAVAPTVATFEAEIVGRCASQLPDEIDLFRAIKRSGQRSRLGIAKALAELYAIRSQNNDR